MSLATAKNVIDWIFTHVPDYVDEVVIDFIGGESLLKFKLIKEIVSYVENRYPAVPYIFFADTNGTILTTNKNIFKLGLSLDGRKDTHDHNRSNSFDSIDIDFFIHNYPEQGVKMTLSEYSLHHLADDVKYIHSLGLKK